MAREIIIHCGPWNIRYTPNGQYADIYYGGSTPVDCINYIHGDGTKTVPDRKQLRADLEDWVAQQSQFFIEIESIINY